VTVYPCEREEHREHSRYDVGECIRLRDRSSERENGEGGGEGGGAGGGEENTSPEATK